MLDTALIFMWNIWKHSLIDMKWQWASQIDLKKSLFCCIKIFNIIITCLKHAMRPPFQRLGKGKAVGCFSFFFHIIQCTILYEPDLQNPSPLCWYPTYIQNPACVDIGNSNDKSLIIYSSSVKVYNSMAPRISFSIFSNYEFSSYLEMLFHLADNITWTHNFKVATVSTIHCAMGPYHILKYL